MNAADAVGTVGLNVPLAIAACVMEYGPVEGTLTVTTAKRMDPSGQRVLTSVWVGSAPTWSPLGATPCGIACPNVTHPRVSVTLGNGACASAGAAAATTKSSAAKTKYTTRMWKSTRRRETCRVAAGLLTQIFPVLRALLALRRQNRDGTRPVVLKGDLGSLAG